VKQRSRIVSRTGLRSPNGFALPSVLGVGLVLVLISMTIILRTLSDRQLSTVQGSTYQSLLTTETGLTRVQNLLIKYPGLAAQDGVKNWSIEVASRVPAATCNSPKRPAIVISPDDERLINAIRDETWINIDPNDLRQGQFQASSYTVGKEFSQLTIKGQMGQPGRTANTAVEVTMPLVFTPPPAGIWVSAAPQTQTPSPTSTPAQTNTTPAPTPTQSSRGSKPIAVDKDRTIAANIFVEDPQGDFDIEAYTQANNSCSKFVDGICNKTYLFSKSTNSRPDPPAIPTTSWANRGQTIPNSLINNQNLVLPRPTDKADADGKYRYLVDTNPLSLGGNAKLTVQPGRRVIIYLANGLTVADPAELNSSGTAESLEIYGSSLSQNYSTKGSIRTQSLLLASSKPVNAFIYAPDAEALIQGGGSIKGAIWVRRLEISVSDPNSNASKVTQSNCFQDLQVGVPNPIGVETASIQPSQTWQRKPVNPDAPLVMPEQDPPQRNTF
jgi:hypothetical protein